MPDQALIADLPRRLDLHAKWRRMEKGGERLVLIGADLRDANMRGADLRAADLRDADLRHADLRDADLRHANLCGADLCGANLRGADLRGADLRGADLCDADLRGADLCDADLCGADLCDADLRDAELPPGYRIASLCFGGWPVTATPTTTTIGCESHPNESWLGWSVDAPEIEAMHPEAAAWWRRHREAVCAVIRDVMQREETQ